MIAHHTAGGCPLRTGDLIGTGTLSGPSVAESGSLLEASSNGDEPYTAGAPNSAAPPLTRSFLEDGDLVEFEASMDDPSGLGRIGFGKCTGLVIPSTKL